LMRDRAKDVYRGWALPR